MARFQYHAQPSALHLTPSVARRWAPTLGIWGVGVGAAVTLFMSDVPIFKTDVLLKVPLLKEYFTDKTPASDKPF